MRAILPATYGVVQGVSGGLTYTNTAAGKGTSWTFACWAKHDGSADDDTIFACGPTSEDRVRFSATRIRARAANMSYADGAFPGAGAWHHICVQIDGSGPSGGTSGTISIYVDGTFVDDFNWNIATFVPHMAQDTSVFHLVQDAEGDDSPGKVFGAILRAGVHPPTDMGYSSANGGEWADIATGGTPGWTPGPNDWFLDGTTAGDPGADASGNGHHFTQVTGGGDAYLDDADLPPGAPAGTVQEGDPGSVRIVPMVGAVSGYGNTGTPGGVQVTPTVGSPTYELQAAVFSHVDIGPLAGSGGFDSTATATFTHATATSITVPVWYDGADYWIRFTPTAAGEWSYTTTDGGSGTVSATADAGARGFLVPTGTGGTKWGRQLGDGTVEPVDLPLIMATVHLERFLDDASAQAAGYADLDDAVQTAFIDLALDHGMRGVHIPCISGRWFDLQSTSSDDGTAISGTPTDPDPDTFTALENIVTRLHTAGLVAMIWGWGDNARNQSPESLTGGENGAVHQRVMRYLAARLGPLPGWFFGYGFDLFEWSSPADVAAMVDHYHAQTTYPTLLSGRSDKLSPGELIDATEQAWLDAGDYADAEQQVDTIERAVTMFSDLAANVNDRPRFSGDRFRIRDAVGGGDVNKDWTEPQTVQGLHVAAICGFVGGIWGNLWNGSSATNQWEGSIPYSAATQTAMATYRTFWDAHFEADLVPDNTLVDNGIATRSDAAKKVVVFTAASASIDLNLSALVGWDSARLTFVDTTAAHTEVDGGTVAVADQTVDLPSSSDWLVLVEEAATPGEVTGVSVPVVVGAVSGTQIGAVGAALVAPVVGALTGTMIGAVGGVEVVPIVGTVSGTEIGATSGVSVEPAVGGLVGTAIGGLTGVSVAPTVGSVSATGIGEPGDVVVTPVVGGVGAEGIGTPGSVGVPVLIGEFTGAEIGTGAVQWVEVVPVVGGAAGQAVGSVGGTSVPVLVGEFGALAEGSPASITVTPVVGVVSGEVVGGQPSEVTVTPLVGTVSPVGQSTGVVVPVTVGILSSGSFVPTRWEVDVLPRDTHTAEAEVLPRDTHTAEVLGMAAPAALTITSYSHGELFTLRATVTDDGGPKTSGSLTLRFAGGPGAAAIASIEGVHEGGGEWVFEGTPDLPEDTTIHVQMWDERPMKRAEGSFRVGLSIDAA